MKGLMFVLALASVVAVGKFHLFTLPLYSSFSKVKSKEKGLSTRLLLFRDDPFIHIY
jgi:hypothetical protein